MSVDYDRRARRPIASALAVRPFMYLLGALAVACAFTITEARAEPAAGPVDFSELAQRLNPAVVNISTSQEVGGSDLPLPQFPPGSPFEDFFKDFFERRGEQEEAPRPRTTSLGSGFVIDAEGYIVTNNHVIADAAEITITFADDSTLKAVVVGRDPKTDIALLKVEPEAPLPAVDWGDSDEALVGKWVLAIGNPFGLGNTVTAGIISATARDINAGPFDDFLQTDAAINRGNSGGPLFNMDGGVVGINTAIYSPSGGSVGVGFAVPSNLAANVAYQLREFGETRRGWLGVRIQTITDDLAESLALPSKSGALVASITEGSPADDAGVHVGDVIIRFDGKEVATMRRLPRIVAETRIGKEVDVEVWREGEIIEVQVVVGRLDETELVSEIVPDEPIEPLTEDVPALGMTLSTLTPELREQFELPEETRGVMVVDIDGSSIAAEKGIRPGDVIVEVGQEEVAAPADVVAKIEEQREQNKNTVLLLVDRNGDLQFVAVRLRTS